MTNGKVWRKMSKKVKGGKTTMIDYGKLVKEAYEAQKFAYAPYSNWIVGAALLTKSGKIYRGCNVENAMFSPSCCGERVAIFKAVSEGEKDFVAIAVVGNDKDTKQGSGDYCAPCGVCRQVMCEFCDENFEIVIAKSESDYKVYKLGELMPFQAKTINK